MSTSQPLVSVIIPNYNYARYLEERIESVLGQDFRDFELILLDDASTDNSAEILQRYRSHPKVSHLVINNTNTGSPFAQWERGIALAQGKYIWIAESDDLAHPAFLSHTVKILESNPQATVAVTMSDLIDSDGNPSPQPPFDETVADGNSAIYNGDQYVAKRMLYKNSCYNASMALFRAADYRNLSDRTFTDMRFTGDWYFWTTLISGRGIAEIHLRLNRFRLHSVSTTKKGNSTSQQAFEDALTVLWILEHNKLVTPQARRARLYGIYRNLTKGRYNASDGQDIIAGKLKRLGINSRNYKWFWLYKHLILPFAPAAGPLIPHVVKPLFSTGERTLP